MRVKSKQEQKHIPERMCVGCRQKSDKGSLLRVVNRNGEVILDLKCEQEGRGAYIHRNADCLKIAVKKRSLERALKSPMPKELYDLLGECINE